MSELQIFQKESFKVRTVEINGEPFFVAKDVAETLGYEDTTDAVRRHCKKPNDFRGGGMLPTATPMKVIPESDVFRLIMRSHLPEAEKFQDWVTEEVLPSIRKHGIYATDITIEKMINDPDFAIKLLTTLKEEKAKRIEAEKTVTILTHVNKTYTMTEIAKELNMKSATELNKKLHEMKIQYRVNDTWVLYSDYCHKGYEEIKQEVLDNGKVVYHRKITQLGREFIIKLLSVAQ